MWKCKKCGSTSFSVELKDAEFNEVGYIELERYFDKVECNKCGNSRIVIFNIAYWEED